MNTFYLNSKLAALIILAVSLCDSLFSHPSFPESSYFSLGYLGYRILFISYIVSVQRHNNSLA